jgi:hypothetical protein
MSQLLTKLVETAAHVSSQWSLAAFAIAAILVALQLRSRGRVSPGAWVGIGAIVILGLTPILANSIRERDAIYRVRVTVLDPAQVPVEDAKVWSSMGGRAKEGGRGVAV